MPDPVAEDQIQESERKPAEVDPPSVERPYEEAKDPEADTQPQVTETPRTGVSTGDPTSRLSSPVVEEEPEG